MARDLLEKIKDWVALFGGIGAISYAVGFIVVTTNLLQYGISDLNLLDAHYVSAGFFFIFLLALTFLPFFYSVINFLYPDLTKLEVSDSIASMVAWGPTKIISPVLLPIWILELTALVTAFGSLIVIRFTFARTWLGQEAITLSSLFTLFLELVSKWYISIFIAGFLLSLVIHPRSKENWLLVPNRLWLIGGITLCLLMATSFYAFEIYPRISPAIGGGNAVEVRFVFDNESAQMVEQLVPLETNFTTAPLRLLDQSDKDYYFLVPDGDANASFHAVQIDKSLVKGVTYNYNISR